MLLLLVSLVAGVLTVLAPCVVPLLPVIIGGSLQRDSSERFRPYIVAGSLGVSVILFTLALKVSTLLAGVNQATLDAFSGGILMLLGIFMAIPELWERLSSALQIQSRADQLVGTGRKNTNKILGAIIIGAALGPVFTSCSPTYAFILASVLPKNLATGLLYLIAYVIGLALALLGLSLLGRRLTTHLGWALDTHGIFRRIIGALLVIVGVGVFTGFNITAEVWLADHIAIDEANIEQFLLNGSQISSTVHTSAPVSNSVLNVQPTPAPELVGLTNWINSPPLTIAGLRGKVVLVDFWTYSCINCIRSLPYVEKWYQAYHSDGLVIIGVSTPEFAFEHEPSNVAAAVKRFGILYPVALDNNYDTWNAFGNNSWPADYLIDKTGQIRYVSLGEGDYPTTEQAIQQLLGISKSLQTPTSNVPISEDQSPETYFGLDRESGYVGSQGLATGTQNYTPNSNLGPSEWVLGGKWTESGQYITSVNNASLTYQFNAKDVYVVAGNAGSSPLAVQVKLSDGHSYGSDDPNGMLTISGNRLYHIVSEPSESDGTVTLSVPPGVQLYTFTFGS